MERQNFRKQAPWEGYRVKDIDRLPLDKVYSVYETLVVFFAPRFRLFVERVEDCGATPDGLEWVEWHNILKKIRSAFDLMERETYKLGVSPEAFTKEELAQINEGLALLAKWFFHLWY